MFGGKGFAPQLITVEFRFKEGIRTHEKVGTAIGCGENVPVVVAHEQFYRKDQEDGQDNPARHKEYRFEKPMTLLCGGMLLFRGQQIHLVIILQEPLSTADDSRVVEILHIGNYCSSGNCFYHLFSAISVFNLF
jgi:hypothetical protein